MQNFGSFRDPAGYVFEFSDKIYRTVNLNGQADYELFVQSGLAAGLQEKRWLIPFHELSEEAAQELQRSDSFTGSPFRSAQMWKMLEVEKVPFLSYPYEWCFHQIQDSAILTLKIQLAALQHGMTLKDASAYNIQMFRGRPIFIDILSFEKYEEGTPWKAYHQFVMHFLGPLMLMSQRDLRYSVLYRDWIDGMPVDFVSSNLPWKSRFSPFAQIHIHYHAKLLRKYESTRGKQSKKVGKISKKSLETLISGLLEFVQNLRIPQAITEWGDYYNDTNYTDEAFRTKGEMVRSLCESLRPRSVCDLGANCGEFSRVLPSDIPLIISADIDPVAVDKNYRQVRQQKERNIYPILQDLCNPSPGIGWMNRERSSFAERAKCDLVLALALIHHLCIGNNLPLDYVASFLRSLAPNAIVEFVPKEDSQTQRLLSSREDIFPEYHLEKCLSVFGNFFSSAEQHPIPGTKRTILLFKDQK